MFDDPNVDRSISRTLKDFLKWYIMLRRDEHDEDSLAELESAGRILIQDLKVFHLVSGPLSQVVSSGFIRMQMVSDGFIAVHENQAPYDPSLSRVHSHVRMCEEFRCGVLRDGPQGDKSGRTAHELAGETVIDGFTYIHL